MPKLSDIRRIIPEDFSPDDQEVASMIAGSYNEFSDELYQVINGQLDFDNLARAKVTLTLKVDSTGKPINTVRITTALASVSMIHIGKIINTTNTSLRLTGMPYIDWSFEGSGVVKINYITGLVPNNNYSLTLEIIQ